jgi:hypothetical protein
LVAKTTARLTATACRWPPDHQADDAVEVGQLDLKVPEHLARRLGHLPAAEHPQRPRCPPGCRELAPGVEVVARTQVVEERQILVDVSIPTEQREDFATPDLQVDTVQGGDRAEALRCAAE